MKRLPQAALIIDLKTEAIAVRECERLQIPILGLVDSNVDPVSVAFPIPGNDDSMRSCELVISTIGEGVEDAATAYRQAEAKRRAEEEERRRVEAEEKARREAEEKAREGGRGAGGGPGAAACSPLRPRASPSNRPRPRRPADGRVDHRRRREGAARSHRRRDDGLQGRAQEAGGDVEKAIEILRVKGQASAAKRSGRETREGVVSSYIHAGGKVGAMVEVQCETDFVARTEEFKEFAREVAIHVAVADPAALRLGRGDPGVRARGRAPRARGEGQGGGSRDNVVDRIVEGQLAKWAKQVRCSTRSTFARTATRARRSSRSAPRSRPTPARTSASRASRASRSARSSPAPSSGAQPGRG